MSENPTVPHPTVTEAAREGRELILATRPYAAEVPRTTAWVVASTVALLGASLAGALTLPSAPGRVAFALLAGLLTVRGFILYHDVQHGALCRGRSAWARVARAFFDLYGLWVLTPPTVWRASHNYHHAHTAKIVGSHIGSYMVMTPAMYRRATPLQRAVYRAMRHPANILFGYFTVFLWGMCLGPLLRNPRKHWDAGAALALHAAVWAAVVSTLGWGAAVTGVLAPMMVAFAAGAYLFYAQHNFPGIEIQPRETWSYTRAALESSSFMEMSPVMHWFTGNIGYHHVHHLNPSVPFYRLPEAMEGVPELRHPTVTSLRPRDVRRCFELKLWDPVAHRMVGYDAASDDPPTDPDRWSTPRP